MKEQFAHKNSIDSPSDYERTLCVDDDCVGSIGKNGTCSDCGAVVASNLASDVIEDIDLSNRHLCVDGSCIGVVGSNGECDECGQPLTVIDAQFVPLQEESELNAVDGKSVSGKALGDSSDEDIIDDEPDDFANRTLCTDGSCLGLLDAEGNCSECGTT